MGGKRGGQREGAGHLWVRGDRLVCKPWDALMGPRGPGDVEVLTGPGRRRPAAVAGAFAREA
jgi:hypothetical protein